MTLLFKLYFKEICSIWWQEEILIFENIPLTIHTYFQWCEQHPGQYFQMMHYTPLAVALTTPVDCSVLGHFCTMTGAYSSAVRLPVIIQDIWLVKLVNLTKWQILDQTCWILGVWNDPNIICPTPVHNWILSLNWKINYDNGVSVDLVDSPRKSCIHKDRFILYWNSIWKCLCFKECL